MGFGTGSPLATAWTYAPTEHTKKLAEDYSALHKVWFRYSSACRFLHVCLASSAIIASVVVSLTVASTAHERSRWIASLIAAASLGLLNASSIGAKSDRWRDAWRRLGTALALRRAELITDAQLIRVKDEAERMIGGVEIAISNGQAALQSPVRPNAG